MTVEFARDVLGIKLTEEQAAFAEEIADKIHKGEPLRIIVARDTGKRAMGLKILQKLAAKYVDDGDGVRASIALREAEKLTKGSS